MTPEGYETLRLAVALVGIVCFILNLSALLYRIVAKPESTNVLNVSRLAKASFKDSCRVVQGLTFVQLAMLGCYGILFSYDRPPYIPTDPNYVEFLALFSYILAWVGMTWPAVQLIVIVYATKEKDRVRERLALYRKARELEQGVVGHSVDGEQRAAEKQPMPREEP